MEELKWMEESGNISSMMNNYLETK